jgi:hypothetical protein
MAKNDGGERIIIPAGTHVARCYGMIDLGTQYSEKFGSWSHKVQIQWELPNELMDDGRPLAISKKYTISLNEKSNLRKDLESWLGRTITEKEEKEGFSLGSMLGAPCLLSVIHAESGGKTYANIAGVMSVPKGTAVPDQMNPVVSYDIENGEDAVYAKLPEWLRTIIAQSKEFNGEEPELEESSDTDVPFGDGPITDAQMLQLKGLFQTKGLTNQQFIAKLPAGVSKPSGLSQVQADRLIKELAEA